MRMFKRKGGVKVPLYCGGPKYTAQPKWGMRHILANHRRDWQNMAIGTEQGWRELADISIAAVLQDPVVSGRPRHNKQCYSRYVYKWSYERNRVVDVMVVRVVFRSLGSHKIITAYPSEHCRP